MRQDDRAGHSARGTGLRKRLLRFAPVLAIGALCALPGGAFAATKVTPANTTAPTLTGTPAVGQTLTCSAGAWTNSPNGFTYAWLSNGTPIAGQTGSTYVVQAADAGKAISCQVVASVLGGEYTITGLPSESYDVSFHSYSENGNYLNQFFNGKASEAEATPVSVTAPSLTSNIDAALQAGGEITGKVTTGAGASLAEVAACAYALTEPHEEECAFTNANGEYTIAGLRTASYQVSFFTLQCGATGCLEEYEQRYYNEATEPQQATSVSVTAPSVTPNINAKLTPVPMGSISGMVMAETGGAGLAGVRVCTSDYQCATTSASGAYTIPKVPAGVGTVKFTPGPGKYVGQYYNNKALVPVNESQTTPNINATLAEGATIHGKVTSREGGAAIVNVEVCAYEEHQEFNAYCVETEGSGKYKIEGVPTGSKISVEVYPEGTPYLYEEEPNVAVIAPGEKEVNVELEEGGSISGRVTNTAGAALVGDSVCAHITGHYVGCGSTNANGEYTILALETGDYEVYFYGEECIGETPCTTDYLGQYYGSAVPVQQPHASPNINAALPEGAKISGKVTSAASGALLPEVEVCATPTGKEASYYPGCVLTGEAGGSASATSNSLAIASPNSHFSLTKKPKFDPKTGDLVFEFEFPEVGSLSWALSFENSDVAFADDLSISNGQVLAEIAKKHKAKGKKHGKVKHCKKGLVKHKGKCVHSTVSFGSGSEQIAAGKVTVQVHASKKALKALKSGHKLHVDGAFTFQSALGGEAATVNVKALVREPKKHKKKAKKHHAKKHHKKG